MAFRPDGQVLATGDYSHGVHLWDAETGTRLGPPLRAGAIVLCLSFSPDGGILAAGTAEPVMQVVLWDLATRAPRRKEIQGSLKESLDSLASKDREILIMRHIEHYRSLEIASRLGITEGAVKARLLRTLNRLRGQMKSES
jgi:RNA polymerase sigma factor (sigma-70 family)